MTTFKEILEKTESGILNHIKAENDRLLKQHNITDKQIKQMIIDIAKTYSLKSKKNVVFHAVGDYGFKGYVYVLYNIKEPGHRNHKSTVSYKWLPKDRRGLPKPK